MPKNTLLITFNRVVGHAECLLHVQLKFPLRIGSSKLPSSSDWHHIKSHTVSIPFQTINMTLVPPMFIPKLYGLLIFSNQFFREFYLVAR